MYTTNLIFNHSSPPEHPSFRPNRFQYIIPPSSQPDNLSVLNETFQKKLDYLNEKLDKQLKISSEIGLKVSNSNYNKQSISHFDRFSSPQNLNLQRNDVKNRIIEEEIRNSLHKNLNLDENQRNERLKKNSPENTINYSNNMGLLGKIQAIQENLGIDVEALLDKIYQTSERSQSPHNPLKKLQKKKKSKAPTPDKKVQNSMEKPEISFQTPQKEENVIKNESFIENSIKEKEKNLMADMKMDICSGLEWMYGKVLVELNEINQKEEDCLQEKAYENVAKNELDLLYDSVLNDKKEKSSEKEENYEDLAKNELDFLYKTVINKIK